MASKYLQKYPVPPGFQQILADFTREVLRDQPANIVEYGAKYFEMIEKGGKMEFDSKYNVKKQDKKYQLSHNPKNAEQITKKATNIAQKVNETGMQKQLNSEKSMTGQEVNNYMEELNSKVEQSQSKVEESQRKSLNIAMITQQVFQAFDTDNSGYLDSKQTKNFLQAIMNKANIDITITDDNVNQFLENTDKNQNNKLSKQQVFNFLSVFLKDFA